MIGWDPPGRSLSHRPHAPGFETVSYPLVSLEDCWDENNRAGFTETTTLPEHHGAEQKRWEPRTTWNSSGLHSKA
jgi:hypothetical protein